jgi:hypothetical protein
VKLSQFILESESHKTKNFFPQYNEGRQKAYKVYLTYINQWNGKVFANHISNKGLISGICRKPLNLILKWGGGP